MPPLQKKIGPQKLFFVVFPENYSFFLKKLLNNKIFNTSFAIKKKTPLFSKNLSNAPLKQFFTFFSQNIAFFEKLVEYKDIQYLICDKKGYIHFWCKMTPDRWHKWPSSRAANKVTFTSTFRNIAFLTHFLRQRIFF